jgi:hypothetical protein
MDDDRSTISTIETAHDENPFCRTCGTRDTIRTEGDRVLVECGAAGTHRGALGRLLLALFVHERVVVID